MFPEIKLSDSFTIPSYIVYLSLLYCFLVFYVSRRVDDQNQQRSVAFDLALILMIGGFLGARLLHVFFEIPAYYQEDWTRILQFWQGGFVFFGGLVAGLVSALIYCRLRKVSFLEWADFYAPVVALGYGLGRISCFIAGCCYGRACDMPWALKFPWDTHQVLRHPTQLYAVLWELSLFGLLVLFEKKKIFSGAPGLIFFFWLTFHGVGRLAMEYFRDDFRGDLIFGQTISVWVSLALILGGVAGLVHRCRSTNLE